MKNIYINELIGKLETTEIWKTTDNKCTDYNEGI